MYSFLHKFYYLIFLPCSFRTTDYAKNIGLTVFSGKIYCPCTEENWPIYLLLFQMSLLTEESKIRVLIIVTAHCLSPFSEIFVTEKWETPSFKEQINV